ncbi:MAG: EscU/YscU/HrcU family type III secretion system export apparatus switch protein, partial [Bdellovibrionales bacterium]|nr:EscU/YscU/HrcU family type III secretion system export apparatus switch protein [Bdellovibrionales bacterium]
TEKRLAELRSEGIVPISCFSLRCIGATVVLGVLATSYFSWEIFRQIRFFLPQMDPLSVLQFARTLLENLMNSFLVLSVCLMVLVPLWGLLQTRFFIHFGLLSFRGSRLYPFGSISLGKPLYRAFFTLFTFVLGVASGGIFLMLGLGPLLGLLNREGREPLSFLSTYLPWLFFALILIFFSSGVVSAYLGRRHFLRQHKMTRREVEQER